MGPGPCNGLDVCESLEVELPRNVGAGRLARRCLDDLAAGTTAAAGELARAKLLVTELVNNAVQHGQGTIRLRLTVDPRRLRADVIDAGPGFQLAVVERDFDRLGGWGLGLVEAESSRWGVRDGASHVWFEIDRVRTGVVRKTPHPRLVGLQTQRV
jgi:anti-sigma regulatory factor (Ser/Thr protein kinase)